MKEYRDMTVKEFFRVLFFSLITLLCVSVLIVLLLIGTIEDRFNEREFSSKEWKINKNKRIEMIDDLMDKQLLDGLSKQEVIAILGVPNESNYFINSNRDLLYYLGPERGFVSMDSEWLLIWLNDKSIVEKYEIGWD